MMKSSVRPFALKSSPKCSRQSGSNASSTANWDGALRLVPLMLPDAGLLNAEGLMPRGESGGVGVEDGAEECLCPPKMPPSKLCL